MMSTMKQVTGMLLGVCLLGGCSDFVSEPKVDAGSKDEDAGSGTETDSTDGTLYAPDVSACDLAWTCASLSHPEDCVADFGLGSNQAGNPTDGYSTFVGLYAYNDHTVDATMIPVPNPKNSEPAEKMGASCDTINQRFALHFKGGGFALWGAGVGMDWGGPKNESCLVEGALDCLDIGIKNDKFVVADAEKDARCQDGNGNVSPEKMDCLKRGEVIKTPRDISSYLGIGFWVAATEENQAATLKVTFPIPDTVRFYGVCQEEVDSQKCFNDYATTVNLAKSDAGKWVYKTVMFDDLTWNEYWGLQLDKVDPPYGKFPGELSIGIKFQVDKPQGGEFPYTDIYLDDIVLIR